MTHPNRLSGAEITVTIKRPSGTVSCQLKIDEQAWADPRPMFRRTYTLQIAQQATLACLDKILTREEQG